MFNLMAQSVFSNIRLLTHSEMLSMLKIFLKLLFLDLEKREVKLLMLLNWLQLMEMKLLLI